MRNFLKWLFGAIVAILTAPIVAKGLEKWAERAGYLDDPSKGLHAVLNGIAQLVDHRWFFPAVIATVSFLAGYVYNWAIRRWTEDKTADLQMLGYRMHKMKAALENTRDRTLDPWPQWGLAHAAALQSLFLDIKKRRLWAPSLAVFGEHDGGQLIIYLEYVGRMLIDGHIDEAKTSAASSREFLTTATRVQEAV